MNLEKSKKPTDQDDFHAVTFCFLYCLVFPLTLILCCENKKDRKKFSMVYSDKKILMSSSP